MIPADPNAPELRVSELLDACIEIAEQAGERILTVYGTDFDVETKDDNSPLTRADTESHRCIMAGLQALEEQLPVLSEEGREIDFATRSSWSRYWLVDPLDGTKEFIKRNGEFTVNIALIDNHRPVLGVVHAPVLGVTYAGDANGAIRIENGKREAMRTRTKSDPPTLVVSRSHQDEALQQLLAGIGEHEAASRGSSLKFCLVADGSADLYPRTGPTSEWDTAAGHAVVLAAGGSVVRIDDWEALEYNRKDSVLNPGFAVIGDPGYDWRGALAI